MQQREKMRMKGTFVKCARDERLTNGWWLGSTSGKRGSVAKSNGVRNGASGRPVIMRRQHTTTIAGT